MYRERPPALPDPALLKHWLAPRIDEDDQPFVAWRHLGITAQHPCDIAALDRDVVIFGAVAMWAEDCLSAIVTGEWPVGAKPVTAHAISDTARRMADWLFSTAIKAATKQAIHAAKLDRLNAVALDPEAAHEHG